MCGRYTLTSSADDLGVEFGVDVPADYQPHYNIAPTQPVPIIGLDSNSEKRVAFVRWGLVPYWAGSPKDVKHTINARAESLLLKPTFREAFLERRCLVIADGFYEWRTEGRRKTPMRIGFADRRLFGLAGVWDVWNGPDGKQFTCAILTTTPNEVVSPIHNRMPVMLTPEAESVWLDPKCTNPEQLLPLLRPHPADEMQSQPLDQPLKPDPVG